MLNRNVCLDYPQPVNQATMVSTARSSVHRCVSKGRTMAPANPRMENVSACQDITELRAMKVRGDIQEIYVKGNNRSHKTLLDRIPFISTPERSGSAPVLTSRKF